MATSIQVSLKLHARLKSLKKRTKSKTFEEVILHLLDTRGWSSLERFGSHPNMRPFAHRDVAHQL